MLTAATWRPSIARVVRPAKVNLLRKAEGQAGELRVDGFDSYALFQNGVASSFCLS
jgi:hypothetical protein